MIRQSKHPKLKPSGIPYFLTENSGGFRKKLEKNEGVEFFSTGSHVENENFVFVFHDVAISSFVQYQFPITKMQFVCLYPQDEKF